MHFEFLRLRHPVAVEERIVAVALLVFVRVEDPFIDAGLVEEALPVGIDLQPRLAPDPEEADVAFLGGFHAGRLIGAERAAVEEHHRVRFVHGGPHPEAGADAVALGAGESPVAADDAGGP